ncbi:sulfurtransferase [Propionigenium maris DSM 9537]|uniref:Sulfurtransferase n=1 Tax=Propionigenium maris DSM 9537 TaxID=1123000 RepID=A0A9W6GJJ4_9FUSO|nr:rhodanese-like domain-containing protein [Propionigenium maris]GLI55140.1 sulfurtransferase [Propionigenium maris DSM 9537]
MKKLLVLVAMVLTTVVAMAKDYSQYANPKALVSAEQAKKIMETEKNVVVIDTRSSAHFMAGHIPGAQNMWRPAMGADKDEYPFGGMRASKEKMEKELGKLGVNSDTYVLIYDAKADYDAARLWWVLDMYGFHNVSLIDGGVDGWKVAGFDFQRGFGDKAVAQEFKFKGKEDYSKLAVLEDVKSAVDTKKTPIIDTRSVAEHEGTTTKKGAFRPGRIPSEIFIPWETAVNYEGDKTFKSVEELAKIYGEFEDRGAIAYCQSGVRSAHTTFVLTQLLGYDNVKNYDGSWIEWSYNKDLPADKN